MYFPPKQWQWPADHADEPVPPDHWAYPAMGLLKERGCLEQYRKDYFNGSEPRCRLEFFEAIRSLYLYDLPRLETESTEKAVAPHEFLEIKILESLRGEFADQAVDPMFHWVGRIGIESLARPASRLQGTRLSNGACGGPRMFLQQLTAN
jgi:hypothetical protein